MIACWFAFITLLLPLPARYATGLTATFGWFGEGCEWCFRMLSRTASGSPCGGLSSWRLGIKWVLVLEETFDLRINHGVVVQLLNLGCDVAIWWTGRFAIVTNANAEGRCGSRRLT